MNKTNLYAEMQDIWDRLGLRYKNDFCYEGLMVKGDCPVHDYDVGIFIVSLMRNKDDVHLHIESLDDSWYSFRTPITEDQDLIKHTYQQLYEELKDFKTVDWNIFQSLAFTYGLTDIDYQ